MSETKLDLSNVKPKKGKDTVTKLDLSKKKEEVKTEENAIQEPEPSNVDKDKQATNVQEVEERASEPTPVEATKEVSSGDDGGSGEEAVVIEEITEEPIQENVQEDVRDTPRLPEGVDKLVQFINDTGGTVEDYVRLNADYSNVDEDTLLREYYNKTKSHLDQEEIDFVMEENFHYDEDLDDERDIKIKKLAKKEEILKARSFLDDLKDKYYEEIKSRPTVSNEQRKAVDFFNRYKKNQQAADESSKLFKSETKKFFQSDFKGFDFNLGEKKFRYALNNTDSIADTQSNIDNILGKFLDEKGNIKNFSEYHKAMYAAQNVDKIVSHFYDQGKADAVKEVVSNSKNITNDAPRQTSNDSLFINGLKVKAVNGVDTSRLKINKKPKN
tara:strand:+ start:4343 stop:5497 length:1155 start_codon:yes stop_codon:yes gene_type:complete